MGIYLDLSLERLTLCEGELDQVENTKFCSKMLLLTNYTAMHQVKDLKQIWNIYRKSWGEINRFQRPSGDINLDYDDTIASLLIY
jgi:hypothetical protein